jgi:hypothetical protein
MHNKGNPKSVTSDKTNIFAPQVDEHIGTCVKLASCLSLSVSMLNTTVNNHEDVEQRHTQCGPFSKQWKSPKHLPLEKLGSVLAAWFKQTQEVLLP